MPSGLRVFDDFHVHGASAPEWRQRYAQLSSGTMRSSLTEWAHDGVHVFRKWMSERVVQQGCLPPGRLCFAMLAGEVAELARIQGRAFGAGDLLVLQGGEEFEIQRPRGMALLSMTLPREVFGQALDDRCGASEARKVLARSVSRLPAASLARLRRTLQAPLMARAAGLRETTVPSAAMLMHGLLDVLPEAGLSPERASSRSAATLVAQCHRIVAASGPVPPGIDELCRRLGVSRRTLQNGFHEVAGCTPGQYLRRIRLNAVRRRLLATGPAELTVSQAATDQGFEHLSRFAAAYADLFEELPSRTARRAS